jgi:hypothetical protein
MFPSFPLFPFVLRFQLYRDRERGSEVDDDAEAGPGAGRPAKAIVLDIMRGERGHYYGELQRLALKVRKSTLLSLVLLLPVFKHK